MKITNIREQKNGRFAIYADGEYRLSLNAQTLAQAGVEEGADISQETLSRLADMADDFKADDRAMTILSLRDHSKEELRRKLARTVGEEEAERAADKMEALGLVDDGRFAQQLAEELLDRRLFGADRAVYELTRKGIDRETAEELIARLDVAPQARILRFLHKKYPSAMQDEKTRKRATAALMRNGFKWEDIRGAMHCIEDED
jgi:regulatory protein